jgi:hypothetical protein
MGPCWSPCEGYKEGGRSGLTREEKVGEVVVVAVPPVLSCAGGDDQGESRISQGSCLMFFFVQYIFKGKTASRRMK